MRLASVTAAALGAVAIATIGTVSTASAADSVLFEYDVECNKDGGFIDVLIDIDADNLGDRFLIELDGVVLDSDVPAGDSGFFDQGPFEDGMIQLWVKTDPGGQVVFGWEIPVTCDGPIVAFDTDCDDEETAQHIGVGLWDSQTQTFDIVIDGVEVASGVASNDASGYLGYGPYPLGDVLVEVYWIEGGGNEPYASATLTEDCIDDDSGAGIPDAGSETAPLLIGATVLTLGGIALLGTRRLRRA